MLRQFSASSSAIAVTTSRAMPIGSAPDGFFARMANMRSTAQARLTAVGRASLSRRPARAAASGSPGARRTARYTPEAAVTPIKGAPLTAISLMARTASETSASSMMTSSWGNRRWSMILTVPLFSSSQIGRIDLPSTFMRFSFFLACAYYGIIQDPTRTPKICLTLSSALHQGSPCHLESSLSARQLFCRP